MARYFARLEDLIRSVRCDPPNRTGLSTIDEIADARLGLFILVDDEDREMREIFASLANMRPWSHKFYGQIWPWVNCLALTRLRTEQLG